MYILWVKRHACRESSRQGGGMNAGSREKWYWHVGLGEIRERNNARLTMRQRMRHTDIHSNREKESLPYPSSVPQICWYLRLPVPGREAWRLRFGGWGSRTLQPKRNKMTISLPACSTITTCCANRVNITALGYCLSMTQTVYVPHHIAWSGLNGLFLPGKLYFWETL